MRTLMSFVCLLLLNTSYATDHYQSGDTLYIWALHGLNLRTGPGTAFQKTTSLPYGETLVVLEKSTIPYNVKLVDTVGAGVHFVKAHPVILFGHWVKVQRITGEIGYVIDQYLLRYQPKSKEVLDFGLNLEVLGVDTLFKSPVIHDGSGLNLEVETVYPYGIRVVDASGGSWGESIFQIPDATIEEVLILFSSSFNDYAKFVAPKNWKEEVFLVGDELCSITFTQKGKQVVMIISCSC